MKSIRSIALVLAVMSAPQAFAGWDDDQEVPGTEPEDPYDSVAAQIYREETAKFEQIIQNYKSLDVFAGACHEFNFRGVTWIVDRSAEPRRIAPSPGTIAAGAATTAALVKDLNARGKGKIQVRMTFREIDQKTGKVTEAVFEITNEGDFAIDTGGFQESQNKQHK